MLKPILSHPLLLGLIFAFGPLTAALGLGAFPAPNSPTKIYTCGNSYTNSTFNTGLEALSEAAGHPIEDLKTAGVAGASLAVVLSADRADLEAQLKAGFWDIVTLQSYYNDIQGEKDAAIEIVGMARENNPNVRVIMFTIWPGYEDRYDPPAGRQQSWNEEIRDAIKAVYPDTIVQVMPVALIYQELYEMIDAGLVPNVPTHDLLFRDGGHPGKYGSYPINACAASMIFNESPIGYSNISVEGQTIEPETAEVFQQVVWDVLLTYEPALMNSDPTISTLRLPVAVEGIAYSKQLEAINTSGSQTWALASGSDPLPAGLNLSTGGEISGTTTATGEFPITVEMTDGGTTSTRDYTLRVDPDLPPTITTETIPAIEHAKYFSQTLEADNGVGALTWSIESGDLPAGVQVLPAGFIIGVPGESGDFPVTLKVADSHPNGAKSDTQELTITVSAPDPETLFVRRYDEYTQPYIDGEFDEPYWNFPHTLEKTVQGSPDATVQWDAYWYLADDPGRSYLMIGAKITPGAMGKTTLDAIDVFFDGNNNDEVIYNYDDSHWRFTREPQSAGARVISGYMRFFNCKYAVTETDDGWQVEILFDNNALGGRGIITAFPEFAVYGFDIAVRQGTGSDIHQKVWQGALENPEDTSPFGTIVFDPADVEPNYLPQLVNGDFTDDFMYIFGVFSASDLPKHVWLATRGGGGKYAGWDLEPGVGVFQRDGEGDAGDGGAGLTQVIDCPPPGDYTLSFEYQTPQEGFQVAVFGASPDGGNFNAGNLTPSGGWADARQFLEPQHLPAHNDTTWRSISYPVTITGEADEMWLSFLGDATGNNDTGIRNVSFESQDGEPPVPADDQSSVLDTGSILIPVLENDSPDTGVFIGQLTQPAHGATAVEGDAIRYTANGTLADGATDSFSYGISNGILSSATLATVTVRIVTETGTYDGDGDTLPDGWELANYGDLTPDGAGDLDEDGVTDAAELAAGRNANGIDRAALSFLDDFEDRGPGALSLLPNLWSLSDPLDAAVIQPALGAGGSQGLEIVTGAGETTELTQYLEPHWEPAVWMDFQAILAPFGNDAAPPELDPESVFGFYLTEDHAIHVRNGAAWETLVATVDPGVMHKFAIKQNFIDQTWELWIDDDLVTPTPLTFATERRRPAFFKFSQGGGMTSVLDDLRIQPTAPAGLRGIGTYETWKAGFTWDTADSMPAGNPNRDPLTNLETYGFGFDDPINGRHIYRPGLTANHTPTGHELEITWRRNRLAEDLRQLLQGSGDLGSWNTIPLDNSTNISVQALDADTDEITASLTLPEATQYVRIVSRRQ